MRASDEFELCEAAASSLPVWWRHVLIAAGVLIFSSCRGLTVPAGPVIAATAALAAAGDSSEPQGAVISDAPIQSETTGPVGGLYVLPSNAGPSGVGANAQIVVGDLQGAACVAAGGCATGGCAACLPMGPVLGPGDEYLCDGGDFGSPAGVRADWTVDGLEQEDAIAHYDTLDGRVLVTPSNRVCVYAPRFASVRQVVNPLINERPLFIDEMVEDQALAKAAIKQPVASSVQRHAVSVDLAAMPPILFRQRQQAGGLENLKATMDAFDSLAPYANLQIIRLGLLVGREEALIQRAVQSAIAWTGDQAPQVVFGTKSAQAQMGIRQAGIIYQTDGPDSPRLRLLKLASTGHALPGEELEFTLRFDNVGDQVIGNVTIVDNLATRLEYVPETAKSSFDATFVTKPNTGGSTVLRWEINAPLEPGQGGILQFRARVR
jgi:uncharacterized repeat protein (TIGR01451 family)